MNTSVLEQRAASGDVDAQLELGRHYENDEKYENARGWFARAAKTGSLPALRCLAVNLLVRPPVNAHDGANMIRIAAQRGDADAAYICAAIAAQDEALADNLKVALDYLGHAAELGSSTALAELKLLAGEPRSDLPASRAMELAASIDLTPWRALPTLRSLSDAPRIAAVEAFTSPAICDWLIEISRPLQERATVYDPKTGTGFVHEVRSNSAAMLDLAHFGVILVLLRARIAALTGFRPENLESPSVLHYRPGERFAPHFDFIDPDVPNFARDIEQNGQRTATCLVYLNDDYEGGETAFLELGWQHKGRKGDALIFGSLDASGKPDVRTRHEGVEVRSGEKWVLSQWIRRPGHRATSNGGR